MASYIASLDQGTTSSRCIVFDKSGAVVSMAQFPFGQIYPEPGWVEHDADEIWSTQLAAMTQACAALSARDIAAIGIANQRETTIVWDKTTGRPVCNAIVWQCRRTAPFCEALKERGLEKVIKAKTGLVIDPYFSASKIVWILDNIPGARRRAEDGALLFGTVDTWLLWRLSGGRLHATDYSNASRTMLFNIHTLDWDEEILRELNIPRSMLPQVFPSSGLFGMADARFLGQEIPIAGVAGDQQAALFGQCCFDKGMVKNTYGTGCFVLANSGGEAAKSRHGLLSTIAWHIGGKTTYALEGSVFAGGAAVQWLRDELRLIPDSPSTEEDARRVPDTAGVYFVPAFTGLGAPHWDENARGIITGITRGTRREHISRAALEAIAYQSYDVIKAMEADIADYAGAGAITEVRADGGASANNFLMQFQADILNCRVFRPKVIETTALGAAYLAGLGSGFYSGIDEVKRNTEYGAFFTPAMRESVREAALAGWRQAVRRAL